MPEIKIYMKNCSVIATALVKPTYVSKCVEDSLKTSLFNISLLIIWY